MAELGRAGVVRLGTIALAMAIAAHTASAAANEPPARDGSVLGPTEETEPEPKPRRKMTLAQALAYARANQPALLAARQRLLAVMRDAEVPSAEWRPRVGGFAEVIGATTNNSTTTLLNNPAADVPRVGATAIRDRFDLQPYPSTAVALGVRQQLWDFGRVAAERAALELLTQVERHRLTGVSLDVDFAVAQAYYAVLAADAVEDASRNAFDRAVVHRNFARANVRSGMRPPIELTRAEADVARYEAGMMRAVSALHVARSTFAAAVGVEEDELDAAGELPDVPPLPPLYEVLARAEASPAVKESRARVEAQRGETRRLEAQRRPTLFASAGVNGRAGGAPPNAGPLPPGDGWAPIVPNWHAGVVLSWPILDPTWELRASASRERERALAFEADVAFQRQRALISASWHDADTAMKAVAALERGRDAARANYVQAENRFKVGLGTSTELADAQALRTEAEIQLAIGRFHMARARAALERAIATGARR